jgi:hypothetical protein
MRSHPSRTLIAPHLQENFCVDDEARPLKDVTVRQRARGVRTVAACASRALQRCALHCVHAADTHACARWLACCAALRRRAQLRVIDFGLALDAPGHAPERAAPAASAAASAAAGGAFAAAAAAATAGSDSDGSDSGASSSCSGQFFGTSQYASRRALQREPLSYRDGAPPTFPRRSPTHHTLLFLFLSPRVVLPACAALARPGVGCVHAG